MGNYGRQMAEFLVNEARAHEIGVKYDEWTAGIKVFNPREGTRFARLAERYGWTVHPAGVQWAYSYFGWPEPDERKAAQLAVLQQQIEAQWGTPLAEYGTHVFRANVALSNG